MKLLLNQLIKKEISNPSSRKREYNVSMLLLRIDSEILLAHFSFFLEKIVINCKENKKVKVIIFYVI